MNQALYEQLELARRKRLYPWPETVGIDEHSFRLQEHTGRTEFASLIADKFHVLGLLTPAINRRRKAIAGD